MTEAFEQVTREKVEELGKKLDNLQVQFTKFDDRTTEMFNHMSNRLPIWASILFTLMSSLITGLIIWTVTNN